MNGIDCLHPFTSEVEVSVYGESWRTLVCRGCGRTKRIWLTMGWRRAQNPGMTAR